MRIGAGNFTAKNLCTFHNSELSETDAEAKNTSQILRERAKLLEKRSRRPQRNSPVRTFYVDGLLFERWLLKTLINTGCVKEDKETKWFGSDRVVALPPDEIVCTAFGLQTLSAPRGLYSAAALDEDIYSAERLDFAPLFKAGSRLLIGGAFTFFGHRFVIYVGYEPLPELLELPTAGAANWKKSLLTYHVGRINWEIDGRLSHCLEFRW